MTASARAIVRDDSSHGKIRDDIAERDRLIVALDFGTVTEAQDLVTALGDTVNFYKIGLTLQYSGGLDYAKVLIDQGKKVFLDSKIYDIDVQVRGAVTSIDRMGVDFLTVHGSKAILNDAVQGRLAGSKLKIFVVTVLTSLDEQDLRDLGYLCSVEELVTYRTKIAREAGCDGVIASGLEAAAIKAQYGDTLLIATPAIRSPGAHHDDQKRVATPYDAVVNGADYLVVGRPIRSDHDPRAAAETIRREIGRALDARK